MLVWRSKKHLLDPSSEISEYEEQAKSAIRTSKTS